MDHGKVEYLSIEQGTNDKAIVCISNTVKIVGDEARIGAVDNLMIYKNGSVVAEIDTIKPADEVPNALARVIESDITFEWIAGE